MWCWRFSIWVSIFYILYTFSLNPFCTVSLSSYNTFHPVQCSNNGSNLLYVCLYAPLFDSEFIIIRSDALIIRVSSMCIAVMCCIQFILHHHQHPYHCQCSFLIIRINFIVHPRSFHPHPRHLASNISGAAISLSSSSSSPNQEHFVFYSAIFLFVVWYDPWLPAFIHVYAMLV